MATGFRNPLGKSLASMIMPGDQPEFPMMPSLPGREPQNGGLFKPGSKGQIIAGIIGDTLASLSGGSPVFTQNLIAERRREQEMQAQEAQWTRRRQAEREDKQWEWQNKPKDDALSPALRDARAWLGMSEPEREAYRQYQMVRPQFIPDGLGGGQWASPAGIPATPQPAIGAVLPDPRKAGGPTPRASGGF